MTAALSGTLAEQSARKDRAHRHAPQSLLHQLQHVRSDALAGLPLPLPSESHKKCQMMRFVRCSDFRAADRIQIVKKLPREEFLPWHYNYQQLERIFMALSERRIRAIIREEVESAGGLKKVNWGDFKSLSPDARAVSQRALSYARQAMNDWTTAQQQAQAGPREKSKETYAAGDAKFTREISKAISMFVDAGFEPPDQLKDLDKSNQSIEARRAAKQQGSSPRAPSTKSAAVDKKPLMVAVSDENGNIIRLPEEEALKYFQAQAAETNRKADEAEREFKALRARNDEYLRSTAAGNREELRRAYDAEIARQKKRVELDDIFGRVSARILKQAQSFKQAGNDADFQAMFKLGNTLTTAYTGNDEQKLNQLDQNTARWGIDESNRRRLREGSSPSSVFNRVKDICEEVLMNKSLGMKPSIAEDAAERIRNALKEI